MQFRSFILLILHFSTNLEIAYTYVFYIIVLMESLTPNIICLFFYFIFTKTSPSIYT